MDVTTVLFDLDDTLFDHRHARRAALRAVRDVLPPLGRFRLSDLDRVQERILTEVHRSQVLTGRLSVAESRVLRLGRWLREFGIELPRARVVRLAELRQSAYRENRRAVPGATALLRHLKSTGTAVGVVTNNLRSEQEEKLRVAGLAPWVDLLVCSEQVRATKPDPRIFGTALAGLRSRPGATVMVGDSWAEDIVGAAAVGIRPVWFHRDVRRRPSTPPARELRSFRPLSRAALTILGSTSSTRR